MFTWADHTIADQQYVVKVDPNIKTDVSAIIGCAVMTGAGAVINTANVQANESVAIFGVGGVGLSAVVGARMARCNPIIAVDLDDEKLTFAKGFGATHVVNASREDPVAAIHALTTRDDGFNFGRAPISGADYALTVLGLNKPWSRLCRLVVAVISVPGMGASSTRRSPHTKAEINAVDLLINEKHFIGSIGGSCAPDRDFPRFLEWEENGDLALEKMVTERFSIDQINEATDALANGEIAGRAILEF